MLLFSLMDETLLTKLFGAKLTIYFEKHHELLNWLFTFYRILRLQISFVWKCIEWVPIYISETVKYFDIYISVFLMGLSRYVKFLVAANDRRYSN